MALKAYVSPGVTVSEAAGASLAPFLPSPTIVAIVGEAEGFETATERIILSGTDPVTLKYTGVDDNTVVVKLASTGETLDPGNYVVTVGTDPDTTVSGDEPWTIKRFAPPATAPTVAASGTGALTGDYRYKVAFINAEGETGPGPASSTVTISGAGFNLSDIPVGGAGTTARTVYREKVVGGVGQGYRLVATIANNVATTLSNEATSDATAATAAAPKTGIASGDTVVVTYQYTDDDYFKPTLFDDFDDVQDKYGPAFDADGNIDSKLSYAARLAFLNGARDVVGVATSGSATANYEDALESLEDEPHVNLVVTTSGGTGVIAAAVAHVETMNALGFYRSTIVGQDGSASVVAADTLRTAARAQNDQAVQYVNVSSLRVENPVTGREFNVGGQYMTAALAGAWAGREVAFPLTNQTIAGFMGINDRRKMAELPLDSAAGLVVIEERSPGVLVVKHSVTTAIGDVNWREASIVRAKFYMARRLRTGLEGLIGIVAAPTDAARIVRESTAGILEQLVTEQAISGFAQVKARVLQGDPTTVEVRFTYTPLYPINNIAVIFSVNTQSGDFTFNV